MSSHSRFKMEYRVGVGASSILMVLVILALTAVSLLSLRNAKNAEALTARNVLTTQAYYNASARAQEKLAAMDQVLVNWMVQGEEKTSEDLKDELAYLEMTELEIWETAEGMEFFFVEDAGYDRQIEIAGLLPKTGAQRYRITRYQLLSHSVEGEEDFLQYQLIGG